MQTLLAARALGHSATYSNDGVQALLQSYIIALNALWKGDHESREAILKAAKWSGVEINEKAPD